MIDYKLLGESIDFYEKEGFARIESPWTVAEYIDTITNPLPDKKLQLKHNNKVLVGSGEQSFLYLYLKGFLPKGRFQTVTPCFRYNEFDETHSKYFMKNELIQTEDVSDYSLKSLTLTALLFFQFYIPQAELNTTEEGFDISINGIELGSYGIRSTSFLKWIYGTGCAEPRLSNLIKQYGKR